MAISSQSVVGRVVLDRQTIHIEDFRALPETEFPESVARARSLSFPVRTILATPLLREGVPIGVIYMRRSEVEPFTDKQIELVTGLQLDPAIKAEVDHIFGALGARGVFDGVDHRALRPLLAEIRTTMLLSAKLLMKPTSGPGWSHTEDEILQNTGDVSAGFPLQWKTAIVPRLEGLAERLESADGTFLDVGVGVAALSIAMATLWPSLRVVGIDRWRPSLAIARERVQRLGLGTRIELREQAVEDLAGSQVFDLVWFPSVFISETVVGPALARLYGTLRPGGWLLFPCVNPAADPLTIAYARLRTVFWGGGPWIPAEAQALLNQAGYAQVQTLPSPPAVLGAMSVGRRP